MSLVTRKIPGPRCSKKPFIVPRGFAVEVYPADADVVNVGNLRHLWILPEPLAFAWSRTR